MEKVNYITFEVTDDSVVTVFEDEYIRKIIITEVKDLQSVEEVALANKV